MKEIKYSFFIGERCNFNIFLKENSFLTAHSPFAGTYVSFENAIDCINDKFNSFLKNCISFKLCKNKDINFINFDNLSDNNKNNIIKIINNNNFDFFHKENYYINQNYTVNLYYTNIDEFTNNKDLYYFNKFLIMPNINLLKNEDCDIFVRRINRMNNILEKNLFENTLLFYMTKLCDIESDIENCIFNIKKIYNLKYNLFVVIPTGINNFNKIQKHENIIFFIITFANLKTQIKNNPNDDNSLYFYKEQYNLILNTIKNNFNFNNLIKDF